MNSIADWEVIWRWQWFRRPAWQPYFRDPLHPEGRPARSTPIWEWILRENSAARVLDCSCGLGQRAIMLKEHGFDVGGTDLCPAAVGYARELASSRNLDIPFYDVPWQNLAEKFGSEYDAILNDAFSWTTSRIDLRFAAHNFASILRPGGILIFQGADQWSRPEDKDHQLDLAWQAAPRFQIRSHFEHSGVACTVVVARDKTGDGIVENYQFVIREEHAANQHVRLETASICNLMLWTWADYTAVCREAGFSSLESIKVPHGKREHILNVARK